MLFPDVSIIALHMNLYYWLILVRSGGVSQLFLLRLHRTCLPPILVNFQRNALLGAAFTSIVYQFNLTKSISKAVGTTKCR